MLREELAALGAPPSSCLGRRPRRGRARRGRRADRDALRAQPERRDQPLARRGDEPEDIALAVDVLAEPDDLASVAERTPGAVREDTRELEQYAQGRRVELIPNEGWGAAQRSAKRIGCAPSHRERRPSSGRCSAPSTSVAKWLPASGPALLANAAVAVREQQLGLADRRPGRAAARRAPGSTSRSPARCRARRSPNGIQFDSPLQRQWMILLVEREQPRGTRPRSAAPRSSSKRAAKRRSPARDLQQVTGSSRLARSSAEQVALRVRSSRSRSRAASPSRRTASCSICVGLRLDLLRRVERDRRAARDVHAASGATSGRRRSAASTIGCDLRERHRSRPRGADSSCGRIATATRRDRDAR